MNQWASYSTDIFKVSIQGGSDGVLVSVGKRTESTGILSAKIVEKRLELVHNSSDSDDDPDRRSG
jgi:hypothetical protein